jgi:hypothetical protein
MVVGDTCAHRGLSGYNLCEYLVNPRGGRVNASGAQLHEAKSPLSRPRGYSTRVAAILQTVFSRRSAEAEISGVRGVCLQALHTTIRFHDTRKRELEWYAPNFCVSMQKPIPGRPVPLQASF